MVSPIAVSPQWLAETQAASVLLFTFFCTVENEVNRILVGVNSVKKFHHDLLKSRRVLKLFLCKDFIITYKKTGRSYLLLPAFLVSS